MRRPVLLYNDLKMLRSSLFAATVSACFAMAGSLSPVQAQLKPEEVYSAVSPSVVAIEIENVAGKHFVGNAFLVKGAGLAVTAWHVVHDARRIRARFNDNQSVLVTGVVDKNERLDLALLQLGAGTRPRIKLAEAAPRVGSRVYLVGSPRGLDFSISEGLVSQIRILDGVRYYQLSCPISPGDSGGPVLNDRGEAIGVVSWRKADAENVGFAIPSLEITSLNGTLPALAWTATAPVGSHPAETPQAAPQVRAAVPVNNQGAEGSYLEFQQYLSSRTGKRVTVTVKEGDEKKLFEFAVPKTATR
jgi:serine protease Do